MCRQIAIPPGTTRKQALNILLEMEGCNTDGTGYAYVKNGKFHLYKSVRTASQLAKVPTFLDHLPYKGYTIAHIRAKTHGSISRENTHPFVAGNNCVSHNGVWSDHRLVRLALSKTCRFHGETDSETAAHLINVIGVKRFTDEIDFAGVFFILKRNGELFAIKTSGDLAIHKTKNKTYLLASELEFPKYKSVEAINGYYHFDKEGKFLNDYRKPSNFVGASWKGYSTYQGKSNFPNAHNLPHIYQGMNGY